MTYKYIGTSKLAFFIIAEVLALLTILMYEPSALIPLLLLSLVFIFNTDLGKSILNRRVVFICLMAYAAYIAMAGYGLHLTKHKRGMTFDDLLTLENLLDTIKALFISLDSLIVKNSGSELSMDIKEIIRLRTAGLGSASFSSMAVIAFILLSSKFSKRTLGMSLVLLSGALWTSPGFVDSYSLPEVAISKS